MSGVLVIGEEEAVALKRAMERARKTPVPVDAVMRSAQAIDQTTNTVTLQERVKDAVRRHAQHVAIPFGYRVAISFEQQPAGMCLHLSMSSSAPGRVPTIAAVNVVLEALGLASEIEAADFPGRVWIEEFEVDGKGAAYAVNVVVVMEPAQEGHA